MGRNRVRNGSVLILLILFLVFCANISSLHVHAETWGDYTYKVLYAGTVEITGYTGKDAVLKIPDKIENRKVAAIGNSAFSYCSSLMSVTIPESVISIGDCAFYSCNSLTSVTIANGVRSIGEAAFVGCSGLTNVTIPESVTSIGDSAFSYCIGLTSVTIPESVTNIQGNAFPYCSGLMSINVEKNNQHYCSKDGVLLEKDRSRLVCYPAGKKGKYIVPDSVTDIGDNAFLAVVI